MLTVDAAGETVTLEVPIVSTVAVQDFTANGGTVGLMPTAAGLAGPVAGNPAGLVVSMLANTSTKASSIPTTKGTANPLRLVRTVKGSNPPLRDFTLQGTDQGHLYNGMMVDTATGLVMSNIRTVAIPGSFDPQGGANPPWETNMWELYHCTNCTLQDYEADGQGKSASGFSVNFGSGNTLLRAYIHDCPYSMPTFYQTANLTTDSVWSQNNRLGLNHESVTGRVRHTHLRIDVAAKTAQMHLTWNSALADCNDAIIQLDGWSGGHYGANSPLCLAWGDTYQSKKNTNITPPVFIGPDGSQLKWAEAGHAANTTLGIPATPASNIAQALADPTHWVVRFR